MNKEGNIITGVYSDGYIGKAAQLFQELDNTFTDFIAEYDFENIIIPSIIDKNILRENGYFDKFPHYLTTVSSVSKEMNQGENLYNEHSELYGYLTPAACLYVYPIYNTNPLLQNKEVITSLVKVFRNEECYNSMRRKEYSVREIIFFGSVESVEAMMEEVWSKALRYAKKYFKDARTQYACDNFYPSQSTNLMGHIQIANKLKEELIFNYKGQSVAVASKNYHMQHYSKLYGFDKNGYVVTGCIGFGLDRWVRAIIEK